MPNGTRILALCDTNLLGSYFEENKMQIDLRTNFYKGESMDEERILSLIKSANVFNFVGERAVNLGIKNMLIERENILFVQKIPHAQTLRM